MSIEPIMKPFTIYDRVDLIDRLTGEGCRADIEVEVAARMYDGQFDPIVIRWYELISTRLKSRFSVEGTTVGALQAFPPPAPILPTDPPGTDVRFQSSLGLWVFDTDRFSPKDRRHALTKEERPRSANAKISVTIDGIVRGLNPHHYDASDLERTVARIRGAATKARFDEQHGWIVPKVVPAWVVSRQHGQEPDWRIELREPDHTDPFERTFGLKRLDDAREFCRWMNRGVAGPEIGRIVEMEPSLLSEPDDLVLLARAVPEHVRSHRFDQLSMPGPLLRDWHAALHTFAILAVEGRSGAERILRGFSRLAEYAASEGQHTAEWAPLLWRIDTEGIASDPAPHSIRA